VVVKEYFRAGRCLAHRRGSGHAGEDAGGLRLLSNLETSTNKLIQIVLVGQLRARTDAPPRRTGPAQAASRSSLHDPSSDNRREPEVHQIPTGESSPGAGEYFHPWALRDNCSERQGDPTGPNILCDNVLIAGMRYQKKEYLRIVKEVIADFEGKRRPSHWRWVFVPMTGLSSEPASSWPLSTKSGNDQGPWSRSSHWACHPAKEGTSSAHLQFPSANEVESLEVTKCAPALLCPPGNGQGRAAGVFLSGFTGGDGFPQEPFPVVWTVKKGENLFRLTKKLWL